MSNDELISSIQDNIEKTSIVLEESQDILAQVQHDLNRLVAAGAGVVINHRKRKRAIPKLKVGDFVISKTRPNKDIAGKITGRTPIYFIVTPDNPKYKKFRKVATNLADLSLPGRDIFE